MMHTYIIHQHSDPQQGCSYYSTTTRTQAHCCVFEAHSLTRFSNLMPQCLYSTQYAQIHHRPHSKARPPIVPPCTRLTSVATSLPLLPAYGPAAPIDCSSSCSVRSTPGPLPPPPLPLPSPTPHHPRPCTGLCFFLAFSEKPIIIFVVGQRGSCWLKELNRCV